MQPAVAAFFHAPSNTVSYLVTEPDGRHAAVIDPVLDFDSKSGRTGTASADRILAAVEARGLTVDWVLETHAHADHISAAPYLKRRLRARTGIGAGIVAVQRTFGRLYNLGPDFATDGRQFDHLFADGERFAVGAMQGEAMHTPGHTPACACYRFGDAVFVGDTLFMPDYGTARCDFPGGDAAQLYRSIRRILDLPPETRLFMCHDYGPGGREIRWETTVAEQRAANLHVHDGVDEAAFVALRQARDARLEMPALLLPAVQVNIRAGEFPPPEANGVRYLKLPVDAV